MENYIIIALSIISFLLLFFLIKKNKQNKILEIENKNLEEEKKDYFNNCVAEWDLIYQEKVGKLDKEYKEKKENLSQEYKNYQEDLKNQLEYSKTATQAAKDSLNREFNEYKQSQEQYMKDYLGNLYDSRKKEIDNQITNYISDQKAATENLIQEFKNKQIVAQAEYEEILELLEDFRKRREVVNQQVLREKEIQEKTDFYRIQLTENEIEDLKIIKEVESRFNNKEVLHKAAFDCYIRRPLLEMEKRVLNGKKPSGIYIITYIPTGEIYIGKSTDISNRWQEHCKSAYGVGTIAHSSLHTKMARDGIWNFTFQILEEVPKEKLGEREKYWIEQYNATALLNQKQGG